MRRNIRSATTRQAWTQYHKMDTATLMEMIERDAHGLDIELGTIADIRAGGMTSFDASVVKVYTTKGAIGDNQYVLGYYVEVDNSCWTFPTLEEALEKVCEWIADSHYHH